MSVIYVINLNFSNGTSRTIKDTTYLEREMRPSSHYELFNNLKLNNQYLIYHSYYEDSWFDLLDKNNGDTIARFSDYPFISPNNKTVISVKTPYTDGIGTCFLEINKIVNGKYKHFISIDFANWNISNNKTVYWLSDNEFILKVKKPQETFLDEENIKYFNLKFKIK